MPTSLRKAYNCNINPVLYRFFLRLKETLGAEIVRRRRRKSADCIEIVFSNELVKLLRGRLNTLPEAEQWGFWIICRRQTRGAHASWHGRAVYQLFLSPVHPKKRRENLAAEDASSVTFEPIVPHRRRQTVRTQNIEFYSILRKNSPKICICQKNVVPLHAILRV